MDDDNDISRFLHGLKAVVSSGMVMKRDGTTK